MGGRRRPKIRSKNGVGIRATALRYSDDTPIRLLRDIAEKRVDARTLTRSQRKACLAVLANGKQTAPELGELFGVSASMIRRDVKEIRGAVGREAREWGIDEIVGDLVMTSEKLSTLALQEGDIQLAWAIKRDTIKQLVELGIGADTDGRESMRITIETIGQGYERTRQQLGAALDPVLTGLIVDVDSKPSGETRSLDMALDLPRRLPGTPLKGPGPEVSFVQIEPSA